MRRHIGESGCVTLCGRSACVDRDVPMEAAHHGTCGSCRRAVRAHDRRHALSLERELNRDARRIRATVARGVDGLDALPSEMRATLRRKGIRAVR